LVSLYASHINIDPKRKNVVDKKIITGMFCMKSLEAEQLFGLR
jgi:hypothetical protein